MKPYQKIASGFLGISFFVGAIGFIFFRSNLSVQNNNRYIINNSEKQIKLSQDMNSSLAAITAASQELLLEKNQKISNLQDNQEEIDRAEETIRTELIRLKNYLELSKKLSLKDLEKNPEISQEQKEEERKEVELINKIEKQLFYSQKLIEDYLKLSRNDLKKAYIFFNNKVEPQIENNLIPLVRKNQDYALEEMNQESENITKVIIRNNNTIIGLTLLSISIALGLGLSLSNFLRKTTVSKSYLDNILNSMQDSLIVIDTKGTIKKVNRVTSILLGYSESKLIHTNINYIFADKILNIDPESPTDFLGSWDTNYLTKQGEKIPVAFSSSLLFNEGGYVIGIVCVARDLTDKQEAKKALQESEERYALASRATNDGLWDWNLSNNEIYFSSRWKSMLGYEEHEIATDPDEWFSRVHPDYIEQLTDEIVNHVQNNISHFELSYPILCKDGTSRWMLCRGILVEDDAGRVYRITGAQTDITQSRLAEDKLRYEALHDTLTGLPNRTFFLEELEKSLKMSKQNQDYWFGVLYLDIDRFNAINDSLGNLAGDQLLIDFANRIKDCISIQHKFARLGADEFVILIKNIKDINEATQIADRIQNILEKPFSLQGQEVFITASIGINFNVKDYDRIEDILRDADTAMYQAKTSGGSRYKIFEPNMHLKEVTSLQLENDLRQALKREELQILYQPIVKLSNRQIIGFEALVRWHHQEKGIINPEEFIPIAEKSKLIIPIGWWIIEQACRQMCYWQKKYKNLSPLTVSVNLSPVQLQQLQPQELFDGLKKILEKTGLQPSCLQLEIAENTILENIEGFRSIFSQLKTLGIQLSVDDFGTGNSSLSCLHLLPIDSLKIDHSFIENINNDTEIIELVEVIIALAKKMKIDVIAEGIEINEQMVKMKNLNCDFAQGYLFSKPVNSDGVEILISTMKKLTKLTNLSKFSSESEN